MSSSAIFLSLGTICAVVAVVLVAIAFGTDNWMEVRVNRRELIISNSRSLDPAALNTSKIYFDRDIGLWRECFPNEIPKETSTYLSLTDINCINIQDFEIPQDDAKTIHYSTYQWARVHMMRTQVAFIMIAFLLWVICFCVGLPGCWKRSPCLTLTTGNFLMLAAFFVAGSMGLWHGIEYYEYHKLKINPFYQTWPTLLKINTYRDYGWSYMLAWIGCGFSLIGAILTMLGSCCLSDERKHENAKSMQYLMPVYTDKPRQGYGPGYGYPGPYQYQTGSDQYHARSGQYQY